MSRNRDLANMAISAGLEPGKVYQKASSTHIECRAPNGATATFFVMTHQGKGKDDLDCLTRMKRFARTNPAPALPAAEAKPTLKKRTIVVKRTPTALEVPAEDAQESAQESAATRELTHKEFHKLCLWLPGTDALASVASLEALAVAATKFIGQPVSEKVMREVMEAADTPEPEHWHPLPDAQTIVLQELLALFETTGHQPSRNFQRLLDTVKAAP
jgi:hypothetical protein